MTRSIRKIISLTTDIRGRELADRIDNPKTIDRRASRRALRRYNQNELRDSLND